MLFKLNSVLLVLCAAAVGSHATEPVVYTSLGSIKGSLMKTRLGKTIYSFRSIRYGQAPVDNLRFKVCLRIEKKKNGIV